MTNGELELLYLLYVESKGGAISEAQEEMTQILQSTFPDRDPESVSFEEARAALGL
ncbi:hypothetical protein ES703_54536 [subsurface metagenome]